MSTILQSTSGIGRPTRNEGRLERLQVGDRPREKLLLFVVLGGKELERERLPGCEEVDDPGHSPASLVRSMAGVARGGVSHRCP